MSNINIKCQDKTLKELLDQKYKIDFYQREYVWQTKQIEDLLVDLSSAFLANWSPEDNLDKGRQYNPYFMGEVILSTKEGFFTIIDGQQRMTTFTLLLIYLKRHYSTVDKFPDIKRWVYELEYGTTKFNLDIKEREKCMCSLLDTGEYSCSENDSVSIKNIVGRYEDIHKCWNEKINESNVVSFTYWILNKVIFSQVITNNDDCAYLIFETMNDRGLSLTQTEMLRSYLLANISDDHRADMTKKLDMALDTLNKLDSKTNLDIEFFKVYFRGHLAEGPYQKKGSNSDFQQIGKSFHRWVRGNSKRLNLINSENYEEFISKICFFSSIYKKLYEIIKSRDTENHLYLVVNKDYDFTLQPEPILACINYKDDEKTIEEKIAIMSKYLCKVLSWRIWAMKSTAQSYLEGPMYDLSKKVRDKSVIELKDILFNAPIELPNLTNIPYLNQQNRKKFRVLISLITEIVASNSNKSDYMLNKTNIEIEHIWSDHFEEHRNEFKQKTEFDLARNMIGDLLLLPKSINASYSDCPYKEKKKHYIKENILAQTLCSDNYEHNPNFLNFKEESNIDFQPYDDFTYKAIQQRTDLYRQILIWNWDQK